MIVLVISMLITPLTLNSHPQFEMAKRYYMLFLNFLAINALRNRYLSDDDGRSAIFAEDYARELFVAGSCSSELLPSAIP